VAQEKELIESGFGLFDQEAASALHESKPQPVAQVVPQLNSYAVPREQ
jgi:hypothetical protein